MYKTIAPFAVLAICISIGVVQAKNAPESLEMANSAPLEMETVFVEAYEKELFQEADILSQLKFPEIPDGYPTIDWSSNDFFDINNDQHMRWLSKAIAMHESGNMTSQACINKNNCWGIMQWDASGNRSQRYFETYEAGEQHFINLWRNYYGAFPNMALSSKWSGNDRAEQWLSNVTKFYTELRYSE